MMAAFGERKPDSLAMCCLLLLLASSNPKAACQTLIDSSPDGARSNANSDIGSDLDNSIGVQADVGGHQRQTWPPASSSMGTGKNSSQFEAQLTRLREKGGFCLQPARRQTHTILRSSLGWFEKVQ